MHILGGLFIAAAVVCWIVILIDAFKKGIWKGLVCFFFVPCLLVYAIEEYQAPRKWLIVEIWILGGFIGISLSGLIGGVPDHPPMPFVR